MRLLQGIYQKHHIVPVWVIRDGGNRPMIQPGKIGQQDIYAKGLLHVIEYGYTDGQLIPHAYSQEITCDGDCSDVNITVAQ